MSPLVVPPGGGGGYQPQLKRPKSQRAKRHYGKMGWLPINTTKIQEEIDLEAKDEAENIYHGTGVSQWIILKERHFGEDECKERKEWVEHETSELLMNRLENYLLLKDKIQHKFTQSREKELANSRETLEKDCSEFTLLRPTSTAAGSENRIPGIMTMETKIKRRRRLLRPERKITIINQMNSSNLDDDENAAPVSSTGIDQSDRKMSKKYTNEKRQSLNVVSPDSLPAVAGGIDEDEHGSTTSSGTDGIAT
eukprot:jgi/Bigna1/76968/fgenesh1_pg.45_\